ncbi:hypothetical protein GCK72_015963 [Caenorhabditis remanei]|uniref:DNA2/NAM7 helicase-like C-terminal domain-containing protein n=1 Tax=Caenorhabditis remanei TaxID=31234 RepID=A0A6A5GY33_CAERE|nr:hypothetical protein GCK72_015963 [Caenorhabditis remanei]KAF1759496.1 hypothetical protein GCK72_015963 [Caenorhabditis remanei]
MDSCDNEFDNKNLLPPDSPEPPALCDANEEKEEETPELLSDDVTILASALGAIEIPKRQLTMIEEIERLSEENARIYQEKLVQLIALHNIDLSSSTDPTIQLTGALEHISSYTKEQSSRFLAMTEVWRQSKDLEEKEDAEKPDAEKPDAEKYPMESPLVDTIAGHYAIYQITRLGTSYLTATPVHESLKNIGKAQIDSDSIILSDNGSCYRIAMTDLLLGDTIAVKELGFQFGKKVVKKFLLFKRKILENQIFNIGRNLRPVILGSGEVGVAKNPPYTSGTTHIVEIFFPVNWMNRNRNLYLPIAQPVVLKSEKEKNLNNVEQFYLQTRNHKYSPQNLDYVVVMGSSAITATRIGAFDSTRYSIDSSRITSDNGILKLHIPAPATSRTWVPGTRIAIEGVGQAVITFCPENNKFTVIFARPIGIFNYANLTGYRLVYQVAMETTTPIQQGFFETMEDGTNGKRIIQALFGGLAIGVDGKDQERSGFICREEMKDVPLPECQPVPSGQGAYPITLDTSQSTYIQQIVTGALPITVGNFPILSGKTTTVAIAALESAKAHPGTQHLVYVPDDQGAQILVDRLQSVLAGGGSKVRALRMIGFKDWKNLTPMERTCLDYPVLLRKFLQDIINGKYDLDEETRESAKLYYGKETDEDTFWLNLYFSLVSPQIIIGKFDSIFLNSNLLKLLDKVTTIQLDDADRIPQHDIVQACIQYPHATYGLMGDPVKDRPWHLSMSGFQASAAIGWLVEISVNWKLFPIVTSNNVYGGVNKKIVDVIGKVYYKDRQLAGRSHSSVTPAVKILNHHMPGDTQAKYARELEQLVKLVKKLTGDRPPSEIGVLCFTHKQLPMLHQAFRNSGVHYGHYEAFQGIQKEIVIIWGGFHSVKETGLTMNVSTFMLTRGKQVVYILGSTQEMKNMKSDRNGVKWDALVKVVKANRGVVDAEVSWLL